MEVAHLCRVLEGTLAADNATRKEAERSLAALLPAPGYIPTLLQLIQAPGVAVLGACACRWRAAPRGTPPPPPPPPQCAPWRR